MPLEVRITGDCSPRELDAVAALIASLGGRLRLPAGDGFETRVIAAVAPIAANSPVVAVPAEVAEAVVAAVEGAAPIAEIPDAPVVAPAAPDGVTLDVNGLPWDARIHASTKTTTQDGAWTAKRKVPDEVRAAVVAELRAIMGAAPAPVAAVPAPPPAPEPTPEADPAAAFATPPAPVAAVPTPPPAPVVEAPSGLTPFQTLMQRVVAAQAEGRLTTAQTTESAVALGLTSIRDLMHRPDLIPAYEAMLPA